MTTHDHPDAPALPIADLAASGLLWLINRTTFHPRGFALAIATDDAGRFLGWKLLGDGSEVWAFTGDEDDVFARAQATLAAASRPPAGSS